MQLHHPNVQFTDGDNWGNADNRLARDLVQGMLPLIGLFAYIEVRPHGRPSGLGSTLAGIAHPKFRSLRVTDRQSVLGALDQLFGAMVPDRPETIRFCVGRPVQVCSAARSREVGRRVAPGFLAEMQTMLAVERAVD